MVDLICNNCGQKTYRSYTPKTFTCKHCSTKQEANDTIMESVTPEKTPIEKNEFDDVLELGDDKETPAPSQDLHFRVEPVKVDFQKKESEDFLSTPNAKGKRTGSTPKNIGNWNGETFSKPLKLIDEVMVSKSNKDIWDISPAEEKQLGELWADVANAYAPSADTKEMKLLNASICTGAVYVPRIISLIIEHKKRNKIIKSRVPELKQEAPKQEIVQEQKKESQQNEEVDLEELKKRFANAVPK